MLTKSFQKNLVTKAQQLKPVVQIGEQGLTQAVHQEIEAQLLKHELIKIKVNFNNKEIFSQILEALPQVHHAHLVHKIGRVIVLYREREEG